MPPKHGWIVKLRDLVVRCQSLRGRFAVNSAKTLPGVLRLLVHISDGPEELGKPVAHPSHKFRNFLSADKNENESENENDLSVAEENIGEARRSCY